MTEPSNIFKTRKDDAIALKPWSAAVIAANADNVGRLIGALVGLVQVHLTVQDARGTELPTVSLTQIDAALPALRMSCQDPAAFDKLEGLGELVRFARAVWEFNEIGVGLGEAHRLHEKILGDLAGAALGSGADTSPTT